ncbi:uncharacterized protein HMPREF1541_01103 [Cyphellophora europaea CBS 101466]|uniref:Uncharacterized protein n=1 Tax=Cyphellophora europaea (strain CBS 101466) TaxID=1220924 RepID=W2SGC1_CYPE1|nr:uncharacterized protein HMPREF1541_01103 [Cyphellophora europaea CBS 101466]ETN46914.1 hypothetical protein HMPREF1541_01103 [Cyphellophora europaea CBS 101466]
MSYPPSLSNLGTGNGSIRSHTLLTPPLSPASSEDVPFKPLDTDNTSLSMKRRRGIHPHNYNPDRRRLNRACASSSELQVSFETDDARPHRFGHSKSLPSLRLSESTPILGTISIVGAASADHRDVSKRRWTLPTKSQATRGLAEKVSVENRPVGGVPAGKDNASPAMITLRRASISRATTGKMSLTFFPPPKFERSKSGLLAAFLNTITGHGKGAQQNGSKDVDTDDSRRYSTVSVQQDYIGTPRQRSAAPVYTSVSGMEPNLLQPSRSNSNPFVRRCSTKFISSGSVYEVIWDENISSSDSDTTLPATMAGSRRRSIAVDRLETQFFRAVAQSRRESLISQLEEQRQSNAARTSSISNISSGRFTWPGHDSPSGAQRTKGYRTRSPTIEVLPEETSMHVGDRSKGSIEFFPPLRSRATTGDSQSIVTADTGACAALATNHDDALTGAEQAQSSSVATLSGHTKPGGLVGVSAHMKRQDGEVNSWAQKLSGNMLSLALSPSRRASQRYKSIVRAVRDEIEPLLDPPRSA